MLPFQFLQKILLISITLIVFGCNYDDDIQDGSVLGVSDYLKLLSRNILKVQHFQYEVADTTNGSKYFVMVTDSLEAPDDYARTFRIEIRE